MVPSRQKRGAKCQLAVTADPDVEPFIGDQPWVEGLTSIHPSHPLL